MAALSGAGWFAWTLLTPTEPPAKTFVMLPPGYSTRRIASELKSAGVIRSEQGFILWHYIHRRPLQAGEYLFENPANLIDVQKRLARLLSKAASPPIPTNSAACRPCKTWRQPWSNSSARLRTRLD